MHSVIYASAIGFLAGALMCWLAFRMGISLTLSLMRRARDDYSDPFAAEPPAEIEQEVTQ